jgi:hypothetical protein
MKCCFFFFFFAVLGSEFRASHLLDRRSTTLATLPALFCIDFFQDRVSQNYLPRLASNHDPDLCFLITGASHQHPAMK